MNKKILIASSAILILCIFPTKSIFSKEITTISKSNWNHPNNLAGSWEIQYSPESPWVPISIPNVKGSIIKNHFGPYVLRKQFNISKDQLELPDCIAILGKIDDEDKTYINGTLVGKNIGSNTKDAHQSYWYKERYYFVSKNLLQRGAINTIRIESNNFEGEYGIRGKHIGLVSTDYFFQHYFANFLQRVPLNEIFYFIFIGVLIIQFLWYLFNYLLTKDSVATLWISLFIITIAFWQFFQAPVKYNIIANYVLAYKMNNVFITLAMTFLCLYFIHITKKKSIVVQYVFIPINILTFLFLAINNNLSTVRFTMSLWTPIVIMQYIVLMVLIVRSKLNTVEKSILAAGFASASLSGMYDIAAFLGLINIFGRYITQYGIFIMVVSFIILQSYRFIGIKIQLKLTNADLSELNISLEDKVLDRTEKLLLSMEEIEVINETLVSSNNELEKTKKSLELKNFDLQAAMDEIEVANDNLIRLNHELEDAQRIMQKDMDMAISVQQNFFAQHRPDSNEWEIEYFFKPMAGISGDLYDFYSTNGKLTGVSLFDVSGHGISSGLITMLAKNILFRNFNDAQDKTLSEILQSANNHLIEQISTVEYYLTGILLRFIENKVQYVNAGHSDLLFKAKDQKTINIDQKYETQKGYFLGIKEMIGDYNITEFPLHSGDTLLLYTDCLIESLNNNGEQYGIDAVTKSLDNISSNDSLKDDLKIILDDFFSFIGDQNLNDDLTIILLRKI